MRVIRPNDPGYDEDRQISNARFDYRPQAIYYCEHAKDVSEVIREARDQREPVRIRSGGHQHEGMCTANGVRLIDLSCIQSIEHRESGRVWIGAGAALADVYVDLWQQGFLFSGGGCGDVHVGGLTQGGGWGPVSRRYGLTCDSLVGVEMVTANGDVVEISEDGGESDGDLLWALRGGGGGNFGVVTKFCFRLHPLADVYTDLTLTWGDQQLPGDHLDQLVLKWIRSFPGDHDHDLTTFLRVSVVDDPDPDGDRVVLGGRYLGSVAGAEETMHRLLADQPAWRTADFKPSPARDAIPAGTESIDPVHREHLRNTLGRLAGYQPGPMPTREAGASASLADTCAGEPIRHKVSSAFARPQFDLTAVQTLTGVIRQTDARPEARQYVSLHCLGGAIASGGEASSFAFRDRDVLLQYQAWWQPEAVHLDGPCIAWIENFRRVMAPHTDGAFINFVDRDIALDEYYKESLPRLITMKRRWDPENVFRFEMSIPLK